MTSLAELHQALLVTVATSGMRHDLRNKLGSLRNATFFLKRKLDGQPIWHEDTRVPHFFEIVERELEAAEQIVSGGISELLTDPRPSRVDAAEVVRAAIEMRATPGAVSLSNEVPAGAHEASASADELSVAIRCLLDNAIESVAAAGGGRVVVRCAPLQAGLVGIEVVDDGPGFARGDPLTWLAPFATSKPGRLGLGLNVARRVASRAGGALELTAAERGARAAIAVPAARVD